MYRVFIVSLVGSLAASCYAVTTELLHVGNVGYYCRAQNKTSSTFVLQDTGVY